MSDDWDLLAEEFDKWLEQTTEDGIPVWMIHQNFKIQQFTQNEKTTDSSKPDDGNAVESGTKPGC